MSSAEPESGSRLFEPPRPLEEVAEAVNAALREAGIEISLAEAGTGGEIARLLRPSGVLTRTALFPGAEELAVALRVSPAKVHAFGAISAMVAAEAAADLIDTYEGGWGLVVIAQARNCSEHSSVHSTGEAEVCGFVALGTPSTTIIQQSSAEHIARTVLELLAQQAQRRLRQK